MHAKFNVIDFSDWNSLKLFPTKNLNYVRFILVYVYLFVYNSIIVQCSFHKNISFLELPI